MLRLSITRLAVPSLLLALTLALTLADGACRVQSETDAASLEPSGSEVAVSVVSGALNNTTGSSVAMTRIPVRKSSTAQRVWKALDPIATASAAEWSCSGGSLSPAFDGPAHDPYAYTPVSCSVTWGDDETGSSRWSGPFTLVYGPSCDSTHAIPYGQSAECTITRTTGSSGETRTITGPDGNSYSIEHDTDGANTGWDSSVTPAPGNGGLELACGAAGCASDETLVINGSHLTGTVEVDGASLKIWDHTVTSGASPITVTGPAGSRVVSGSVIVQHNLAKFTSETTFDGVGYGDTACCFPTGGSVSTTFKSGPDVGKTETLTFSNSCGEATLKLADGTSAALTLAHCL